MKPSCLLWLIQLTFGAKLLKKDISFRESLQGLAAEAPDQCQKERAKSVNGMYKTAMASRVPDSCPVYGNLGNLLTF
eukprot:scaffold15539_cov13-Tisochrysis_lutea.AAC.1